MREEDVTFAEIEQALSRLVSLETLVLGINDVSLRWCNIIVTLFTSVLVQGMIVTCGPSVTCTPFTQTT